MLFRVTNTTESDSVTDLEWKTSQTTVSGTGYDAISATAPNDTEILWMNLDSRNVTGHGEFNGLGLTPDNIPSTGPARLVGESIYNNNARSGWSSKATQLTGNKHDKPLSLHFLIDKNRTFMTSAQSFPFSLLVKRLTHHT